MAAISSALEGNHTLEHESVELSAVLDVGGRVPEIFLTHVLSLRQDIRRDEPAAAELPAICTDVTADAGELTMGLVVAGSHEDLLVRQEAVDHIDGVLIPDPF